MSTRLTTVPVNPPRIAWRVVTTLLLAAFGYAASIYVNILLTQVGADAAIRQVNGTDADYAYVQFLTVTPWQGIIVVVVVGLVVVVWTGYGYALYRYRTAAQS